jgi:hypothetical protein
LKLVSGSASVRKNAPATFLMKSTGSHEDELTKAAAHEVFIPIRRGPEAVCSMTPTERLRDRRIKRVALPRDVCWRCPAANPRLRSTHSEAGDSDS